MTYASLDQEICSQFFLHMVREWALRDIAFTRAERDLTAAGALARPELARSCNFRIHILNRFLFAWQNGDIDRVSKWADVYAAWTARQLAASAGLPKFITEVTFVMPGEEPVSLRERLEGERRGHAETRAQVQSWRQRYLDERAMNQPGTAAFLTEGQRIISELTARADALEADRDRAQKWLDEFQGAAAAETIRAMEATSRAELAEAKLAVLVDASEGVLKYHEGGPRFGAWGTLDTTLSDLAAAATAYRDRVRAEVLSECIVCRGLAQMASEKGGTK